MASTPGFEVSALWLYLGALYCVTLLPLVTGLPPVVAIMESVYVMTGREIWKQMARFWGRLFGIALLAWATGTALLTILYVTDNARLTNHVHGFPGPVLVAFFIPFLLATGLLLWNWFRDWWGLGRMRHLLVTWLWVLLSSLEVLAVAMGYGLLDNPAGADLDPGSLQVWIHDIPAVLLNPAAQSRFVHLMGACYLAGAAVVLAISARYLLHHRNVRIARRSLTVAAGFGLAAALSLAVLGDRAGYADSAGQQMRLAAIAAEWHTRAAPAPFTISGFPDAGERVTHKAVEVPWLLGIGATHSWNKPVAGLAELEAANANRIRHGVRAFTTLDTPWANPQGADGADGATGADSDLGYGLLLLRHTGVPSQAAGDLIAAAARDTLPNVPLLFWSFRAMVLLDVYAIVLFGCAFWLASGRRLDRRWFLHAAVWSLPVPWMAGALGWVVSEGGRGAWLVDGLLPVTRVFAGRPEAIIGGIACTAIMVVVVAGVALAARLVRLGPEGLKLWPVDPGRVGAY